MKVDVDVINQSCDIIRKKKKRAKKLGINVSTSQLKHPFFVANNVIVSLVYEVKQLRISLLPQDEFLSSTCSLHIFFL